MSDYEQCVNDASGKCKRWSHDHSEFELPGMWEKADFEGGREDEPTCGYAVLDDDGTEEPCGRFATGWRWYQEVEHEDLLDVACEWHQNEGGRRIHEAEASLARAWSEGFRAGRSADHNSMWWPKNPYRQRRVTPPVRGTEVGA